MTLGDWITWLTLIGGAYALLSYAWRHYRPELDRLLSIVSDWLPRDYVTMEEDRGEGRDGIEYRPVPDMYHIEPAGIDPAHTSMMVADEAELIRHLARIRLTTGEYAMSANKIVAASTMSRNDALALIRSERGQPDPIDPNEPQFIKSGPRETYDRVGVKPLR